MVEISIRNQCIEIKMHEILIFFSSFIIKQTDQLPITNWINFRVLSGFFFSLAIHQMIRPQSVFAVSVDCSFVVFIYALFVVVVFFFFVGVVYVNVNVCQLTKLLFAKIINQTNREKNKDKRVNLPLTYSTITRK